MLSIATSGLSYNSAETRLSKVVPMAVSTNKGRTLIAISSCIPLVVPSIEKIERKPMVAIGSRVSMKCAFVTYFTSFSIFKM